MQAKSTPTENARPIRILAISGSLRAASVNAAVLRSAAKLAPSHVHFTMFDGLGSLPLFNPDLDNDAVAGAVKAFRHALIESDGVMIACPEYAHGVPGAMKNALDWVVASGELTAKPVALINAAPRANMAQASLAETLTVMSVQLVATTTLPITVKNIDQAQILADANLCQMLTTAVDVFAAAILQSQNA